jgi:hypothetical protein
MLISHAFRSLGDLLWPGGRFIVEGEGEGEGEGEEM